MYGIFSWFDLGVLTATYSIDGSPYSSSISVTTSSPSYLNKDGEVSNYLYFGHDSLSSGTHSLLVNITEATNQTFILDYITYTPSFDTLSSMPSLSSNVTSMPSSTATGSQHSASTGAIVGGVIGGLAFGVLMTILVILFILRRRRALERDYAYQDTTLSSSVNSVFFFFQPFPLIHPGLLHRSQHTSDARTFITSSTTAFTHFTFQHF